ncbi:YhbP family protein [Erwinia sp. CGal63]|uniref:YhbP family protein n=1 Tax=Erwinia sp. CGal63 TaxID=2919889 RepID=UPI003008D6B1
MSEPEPLQAISRYLQKQHVLAVCGGDPVWCANCFYVFNAQKVAFWLMTEEKTRHGGQFASDPRVAGTISGQPKSVMLIKGVQYAGEVRLLAGEEEAAARRAYIKRFPVAAAASAPIWEIVVSELKMVDNALGFGKKLVWQRSPESR